jgi:hypothetical protein
MEKFGSFEVIRIGGEEAEEAKQELVKQEKIWLDALKGMPAEPLIKGLSIMSNLAEITKNESLKNPDQKLAA